MSTVDFNTLLSRAAARNKVSREFLEALVLEFHQVPWDRREKYLDALHTFFNKKLEPGEVLPPWRSQRSWLAIFDRILDRVCWCCTKRDLPKPGQREDADLRIWKCYFVL